MPRLAQQQQHGLRRVDVVLHHQHATRAARLAGGGGNDLFDFNALSETGLSSTTWDVITDFVKGQDKIDLSTLDANTATTASNEAFTSIIGSATTFSAAGQLKVVSGVLYGNTDADTTAEFAIQLTGISSVSLTDFVL